MEYLSVEQIEDILDKALFEDFPDKEPSKLTDIQSNGDEMEQECNTFDNIFSNEIKKTKEYMEITKTP